MLGSHRRISTAGLAIAGLLAALAPAVPATATAPSAGYLPVASGTSVYVSQGNCVNGTSGIPDPTHCNEFNTYAFDFVYAHNGQPTNSQGSPIVSAAAGTVIYAFDAGRGDGLPADCQGSGSGNFVIVEGADGTYTQYLHLQDGSVAVAEGSSILLGQPIGNIGSSGDATGAHLHFSWVTAVDHCGVGISTPGSFVGQSNSIPVTGDVLTSNNPGPLPGRIISVGGITYVVAGGAPILLPDCGSIYGPSACANALALPSLQGLAARPVNGTDLLAEPSGLAFRVVGGAPVPIPDCASFSTCASDAIQVPDAAISTPDDRLSLEPAEWTVMKTGGGSTVFQYATGCVRSSDLWFDPTYATLVPATAIGLWAGCPLPEPSIQITRGSPKGSNIFFSLWDQDGSIYGVSSDSKGPQAALVVSFTGVPKSAGSLQANVATKASRSCTQTTALWNWKSDSWNTVGGASVSSPVKVRTGMQGNAPVSAYVGGRDGTVRLRLSCQRRTGRFGYSVDWTQVLFVP